MLAKENITPDVLRQLLRYEPETGKLFWRERDETWFSNEADCRRWNTRWKGQETFRDINIEGYLCGKIKGITLKAHRVAWAIEKGFFPDQIDHISGDKADNRISNLRAATHHINGKNRPKNKNNSSGRVGVYRRKDREAWRAIIIVEGVRIDLGTFDTMEGAIAARVEAEKQHGFHPNHGRPSTNARTAP